MVEKLEKAIEQKLVKLVEANGGRCIKWTSPSSSGVPDRIVILPHGRVIFIETKRPKGGRLSPMQRIWRDRLIALEQEYYIISNESDLELFRTLIP